MNTSYAEKSAWIQLISMIVVFGSYFFTATDMLSGGMTDIKAFVPLFITAVVLLVFVMVAGHVIAALISRPEGRDERDRLIGWRAANNSGWILRVGVLAALTELIMSGSSVWIAHLLLLSLLLSEVVRYVLQIIYYRRGI